MKRLNNYSEKKIAQIEITANEKIDWRNNRKFHHFIDDETKRYLKTLKDTDHEFIEGEKVKMLVGLCQNLGTSKWSDWYTEYEFINTKIKRITACYIIIECGEKYERKINKNCIYAVNK